MKSPLWIALVCAAPAATQSPNPADALADELVQMLVESQGPVPVARALVTRARAHPTRPAMQHQLLSHAVQILETAGAARPWTQALLHLERARAAAKAPKPTAMRRDWQAAAAAAQRSGNASLIAFLAAQQAELAARQAAFAALAPAPGPSDAMGRYLCFVEGNWQAGLAMLKGSIPLERNILDNKGNRPASAQRYVSIADSWRARLRKLDWPAPQGALAAQNVRRHALRWYRRAWPLAEGMERDRIAKTMRRLEDQLLQGPGPGRLRFATAAMADILTQNGLWKIERGRLVGKNTGPATWSTFPYAFVDTTTVVIRGGIRSADTRNFRVQAGTFNAIFNWEVHPENHFWFGDRELHTKPPLFAPGKEHELRLRQVGSEVFVFFDGQLVTRGRASLSGTVAVYPALGSEIFVREILVDGTLDVFTKVEAPIGRRM